MSHYSVQNQACDRYAGDYQGVADGPADALSYRLGLVLVVGVGFLAPPTVLNHIVELVIAHAGGSLRGGGESCAGLEDVVRGAVDYDLISGLVGEAHALPVG